MTSAYPIPPPASAPSRQRVVLRDAARACYCQMYYWGRDVMDPGGNLLVRYGFEKIQRTCREGTSRYRMAFEGGLLELHGFCAGWYASDGPGICFDRKHDAWRLWHDSVPPDPAAIQAGHGRADSGWEKLETLVNLSAHFSRWLLDYETWIGEQLGLAERRAQHRDFLKLRPRRWWLPPDLSLQWLAAYASNPATVHRPKSTLK